MEQEITRLKEELARKDEELAELDGLRRQVAEYNEQIASLKNGHEVLLSEAQRVSDQLNREHEDYILVPRRLWGLMRGWIQVIDRARTAGPHLLSPNQINDYLEAKRLIEGVKD